jgi:hypothetical protein
MTDTTQLKPGEDNVLTALDARPATAFERGEAVGA